MKINETLYFLGEKDNCTLFENLYPVNGMTYNSYLIKDNISILLDTVDKAVSSEFIENLQKTLDGRTLDYIIVNHTEPDHTYTLAEVIKLYPNTTLVINKMTKNFLINLYNIKDCNMLVVDETSSLTSDNYDLCFYTAPMVHWPEVMVTYDKVNKILFSADAFGTFGIFDSLYDKTDINEYRRYYSNICGKFGVQVNNLINKLNVDIDLIAPLHGPLIKDNIKEMLCKYKSWSNYESEDNDLVIIYSSIYENTKNLCLDISTNFTNVKVFDVSTTHFSYLISEIFKSKNILLASIAYNAELFPYMNLLINEMKSHNISNKNLFLIENGSWAPNSNKIISSLLEDKNNIISKLTIKGCIKDSDKDNIDSFINTIKKEI
ncbi:MAG: FprA family A-type flavoprotein [bacterium]